MEAREDRYALQHLAAVRLEGATDVADAVTEDGAACRVGDPRGEPAAPRILPAGAHAGDDVRTLEALEEQRKIGGIVLEIGI